MRLVFLALAAGCATAQFGKGLLADFVMAANYTNLNHGSYGCAPKVVLAAQTQWRAQIEARPDQWYRWDMFPAMAAVRAQLAEYVSANASDLVFVENASEGVNSVLRSLRPPPGMKILILMSAYGMVKNTLAFEEQINGQQVLMVNFSWPATPDEIVAAVATQLALNPGKIYAASFSHIVSLPGAILPVKELTALCHANNVLVMIDGAHALGHIPINVTDINADFYLSNGHKWFYSPKGSAILWVRSDRQNLVFPTTISNEGQGISQFQIAFSYEGTSDNTAFVSMAAALAFRQSLGDAAIMAYMHTLAVQGGALLAIMWETDVLLPESMYGAMVDVRVPTTNVTLASVLPAQLLSQYGTWVPMYPLITKNSTAPAIYVRVSAQIYNGVEDFFMLGQAVQQLLGLPARPSHLTADLRAQAAGAVRA